VQRSGPPDSTSCQLSSGQCDGDGYVGPHTCCESAASKRVRACVRTCVRACVRMVVPFVSVIAHTVVIRVGAWTYSVARRTRVLITASGGTGTLQL
jgi:hypothetical protein